MLNSFYGGQQGRNFKISKIFNNKVEMEADLNKRWQSNIGVGEFVIISYGMPNSARLKEKTVTTNINKRVVTVDEETFLILVGNEYREYLFTYINGIWTNNTLGDVDLNDYGISVAGNIVNGEYFNLEVISDYIINRNIDLETYENKSYNSTIWEKIYTEDNVDGEDPLTEIETLFISNANYGIGYKLIASMTGNTPKIHTETYADLLPETPGYFTIDTSDVDRPVLIYHESQEIEWHVAEPIYKKPESDITLELIKDWDNVVEDRTNDAHFVFSVPKEPISKIALNVLTPIEDPQLYLVKEWERINEENFNPNRLDDNSQTFEFSLPRAAKFYYGELLGGKSQGIYDLDVVPEILNINSGDYYINKNTGFIYFCQNKTTRNSNQTIDINFPAWQLLGDMNEDGQITLEDAEKIQQLLSHEWIPDNIDFYNKLADIDKNGYVTSADIGYIQQIVSNQREYIEEFIGPNWTYDEETQIWTYVTTLNDIDFENGLLYDEYGGLVGHILNKVLTYTSTEAPSIEEHTQTFILEVATFFTLPGKNMTGDQGNYWTYDLENNRWTCIMPFTASVEKGLIYNEDNILTGSLINNTLTFFTDIEPDEESQMVWIIIKEVDIATLEFKACLSAPIPSVDLNISTAFVKNENDEWIQNKPDFISQYEDEIEETGWNMTVSIPQIPEIHEGSLGFCGPAEDGSHTIEIQDEHSYKYNVVIPRGAKFFNGLDFDEPEARPGDYYINNLNNELFIMNTDGVWENTGSSIHGDALNIVGETIEINDGNAYTLNQLLNIITDPNNVYAEKIVVENAKQLQPIRYVDNYGITSSYWLHMDGMRNLTLEVITGELGNIILNERDAADSRDKTYSTKYVNDLDTNITTRINNIIDANLTWVDF